MSHTQLKASIVKQAADRYLERREMRIKEKREAMIAAALKPTWLQRVFKLNPPTRAEVIKELTADSLNDYSMVAIASGKWVRIVENVRRLAEVALASGADTVNLDAEAAKLLETDLMVVVKGGSYA